MYYRPPRANGANGESNNLRSKQSRNHHWITLVSEAKYLLKICSKSEFLNYSHCMAIENILAQIDSEIAKLSQARKLLANIGTGSPTVVRRAKKAAAKAKPRKKHVLSAEARKRIADAQRKRWAAQRAKTKVKA
jgi:hypothetical protein